MRSSNIYKDINGEWLTSDWVEGRKYWTGDDAHTYFTELVDEKDKTVKMIGHDNCWCQGEKYNKKKIK